MEAVVREGGCQRREVRPVVGRTPEATVDESEGEAAFGAIGAVGGGLPDVVDIGLLHAGDHGAIGGTRGGGQDGVLGVGAAHGSTLSGLSLGDRVGVMQKWEYLTAPVIIHNTKAILDNFGEDGWELVQIVEGPGGGLVAYFKRPKEA